MCVRASCLQDYVDFKIKHTDPNVIDKWIVRRKLHVQRLNQMYALTTGLTLLGESIESAEIKLPQGARSGMTREQIQKSVDKDKDVQCYIKDKSLEPVFLFVTIKIRSKTESGTIIGTPDFKVKNDEDKLVYKAMPFKLVNMDSFWWKHKERRAKMTLFVSQIGNSNS